MEKRENPYLRVHRIESNRRGFTWLNLVMVIAALIAAPLAEPAILHFIQESKMRQGLAGLVFRMQALIAAAMALQTYSALIRGPDRPVLDPHPVRPRALLKAIAFRGFKSTIAWPISVWILAWPLCLHGRQDIFIWLALPVFTAWIGMKGLGYFMGLGAVWASRSQSAEPFLDLLRGNNPREQASFIYAPGLALFVIGLTLIASANSIEEAIAGDLVSLLALCSPVLIGIAGWFFALRLAPLQYVPASAVLAEIDARWAALEAQDEGEHVYLDWLAKDDSHKLRAFRQGWRSLRMWPLGAGLAGALGLIAAWSQDFQSATLIAAMGTVFVVAIPFRMAKGDPVWLDLAIGVNPNKVLLSRAWTAFWYAQGAIIPSGAMIALRGGGFQSLLLLSALAAVTSVFSALLAKRFRSMGLVVYAPVSLLLWALIGRV